MCLIVSCSCYCGVQREQLQAQLVTVFKSTAAVENQIQFELATLPPLRADVANLEKNKANLEDEASMKETMLVNLLELLRHENSNYVGYSLDVMKKVDALDLSRRQYNLENQTITTLQQMINRSQEDLRKARNSRLAVIDADETLLSESIEHEERLTSALLKKRTKLEKTLEAYQQGHNSSGTNVDDSASFSRSGIAADTGETPNWSSASRSGKRCHSEVTVSKTVIEVS
jgi:septal ring factor EnvC (AmiA/AmiB activator)